MDAFLTRLGRNRLRLGFYIFHSASNRLPLTPGNVYKFGTCFFRKVFYLIWLHQPNRTGVTSECFSSRSHGSWNPSAQSKVSKSNERVEKFSFFSSKNHFLAFFISSRRKKFPFDATSCESELESSIIVQLKAPKFWYKKVKSKISQKLRNGSFFGS